MNVALTQEREIDSRNKKEDKMKNKIWVVEMWNEERTRWEPTIGAGIFKHDANKEKREWSTRNPDDRFRVRKYNAKGEG